MEFTYVPAADVQTDGPVYDYRIGRFEVRNDQFAGFLNDALANLDNERGHYMYFDVDSGDVYINSTATGAVGTSGSGTLLFSAEENPHIFYNAISMAYETADEFEDHPVTGISWFGAVKFCNWMTIENNFGISERAYTEAPGSSLTGWHPVTITTQDWATRDMTAAERDALLELLGFRLPMDGGRDSATAYGEWFKAAAGRIAGVTVTFDAIYGFGRSAITPADANYDNSSDPFEPGTTPVGYYDGTDHGGAFSTAPNENAYGAFDLSGNVWEWLQDQAPTDPTQRRNRGGSWRSIGTDLRVALGVNRSAIATENSTGFRVVQRVLSDFTVAPPKDVVAAGPWGGPYDIARSDSLTYEITNVVAGAVSFEVSSNRPWVSITPQTGSIAEGESVEVIVTIEPTCVDGLTIGENVSKVSFRVVDGPSVTERAVRVTVREPLTITPSADFSSTMNFSESPTPAKKLYTLENASQQSVNWSVSQQYTTQQAWVILPTGGDVLGSSQGALSVTIDAAVVAGFDPGTYTTDITVVDDCTGATFHRAVILEVLAPFSIAPEEEAATTGVFGGPFDPPSHEFTITNLIDDPVSWSVSLCSEVPGSIDCTAPPEPFWLAIDLAEGTLFDGDFETIIATITAAAQVLDTGDYSVTLRFTQPESGFTIDRVVTLVVTGLKVDPEHDVEFGGPFGGPFAPDFFAYTVRNTGLVEMSWAASITFDPPLDQLGGINWLDVTPTAGVIVDDKGAEEVIVAPSGQAPSLASGAYTATIQFLANGAVATRKVTLIVGDEAFSVAMVAVPAEHAQPAGPTYDFRIGRYEITNAEFTNFLNNTRRNALSAVPGVRDARSDYMFFDVDSGDVYINDQQAGEEGIEAPSATLDTLLFAADVGGAIEFINDQYVVVEGKEDMPAVGVSWFGAVKFCNWMTIIQGMDDPDERAYHEGPTAADWYAVLQGEGMLSVRGFRLPMDGQSATASAYNEWFKAAAWIETTKSNATYGFGRDELSPADANYRESDDPFEPGPSSVGFFDGTNALSDGSTLTAVNENGYGLFDLTGNVAEWMHDAGNAPQESGVRGGHFDSVVESLLLRNDTRNSVPTGATLSFVGFRVAQVTTEVDLEINRPENESTRASGFVGGALDREQFTLQITNPQGQTVDNLAIDINVTWLEVDGVAPTQVPPQSTIQVPLRIVLTADSLGVSPAPPGDFAFVPRSDSQTNGPDYDFWIGQVEVTNAAFAAFLNDARSDALSDFPSARSHHMYFDLDLGSVYINTDTLGDEGFDAPSPALTTRLYDASVGRIQISNDAYRVQSGFENHPVVGVSWYGAVKYCNWRSIFDGIPIPLLAYDEAPSPNLDGWRPVVVDDLAWSLGPLSNDARRFLVEDTRGYRLPMDDGAILSSLYNEWQKAASHKGLDDAGAPTFDAVYGFGRDDPPTGVDANYFDSGETEENATTPIRFFNGNNALFLEPTDCYPPATPADKTIDTDNGYGLYDACGNVAEWMQDPFNGDLTAFATRGGSWRDAAESESLKTTGRGAQAPDATNDYTGFRLVRGTGHVATVTVTAPTAIESKKLHYILDLREPFDLSPRTGAEEVGLYGDTLSSSGRVASYTMTNRSALDMGWEVTVDQTWIDVSQRGVDQLSGTLTTDEILTFDVEFTTTADDLGSGEYQAVVTFRNVTTNRSQTRRIDLTVDPPISVAPLEPDPQSFSELWGGPFHDLTAKSYTLSSVVQFDLNYEVVADQSWLTVEPTDPGDALTGALPAGGSIAFDVKIASEADAFVVGEYDGLLRFVFIDPTNNNLSNSVDQEITLIVEDPIAIAEQFDEPWRPALNPEALPAQDYTLTNAAESPIEVTIEVDVEWVNVSAMLVEVLPGDGQQRTITATLNANALALFDGVHVATITFEDIVTGILQCRTIELNIVEDISVAPFDDFLAAGVAGGPIRPSFTIYTLTNVARDAAGPLQWEAAVQPSVNAWVRVNGLLSTGGSRDDGEATAIVVSIDPAATATLAPGVHTSAVEFRVLPTGDPVTRYVSLTIAAPSFALTESLVAGEIQQPGGPTYSFEMGTFHTTNQQFVAFLNDAIQNPSNERGQYMFFDSATGDVYVNSAVSGETAVDPGSRTVKMFSPAASGRIEMVGGFYEIVADVNDFSQHPVTGVSWYGAMKYCNWLTIDQGMLATERCYAEDIDTNLAGWHSATITTDHWSARDLNASERLDLVTRHRGYRLPMDQGFDNTDVNVDAADTFDEWYKAAAWNAGLRTNTTFGFGRVLLTGADANYQASTDPFDNGTTPAGYFDGSIKEAFFQTNPNENGFGLYDMTGNVFQWIQGRFNNHPASINFRTIRGGGWDTPPDSVLLGTNARTFTLPTATDPEIGFRVVRTHPPATGDFNLDGDVDRTDLIAATVCLTGPAGDTDPQCLVFDLHPDTRIDLRDFAELQIIFNTAP